ncbi:MAG: hypothetical protein ACK55I_25475 [bacterium]
MSISRRPPRGADSPRPGGRLPQSKPQKGDGARVHQPWKATLGRRFPCLGAGLGRIVPG